MLRNKSMFSIAALKGKLGNTDYYVLVMKAGDLVDITEIPSETSEWKYIKLEEREQRDINYKRVKEKIAPYLAANKDRFFGSIILTSKQLTPKSFEPISKVTKEELLNLYEPSSQVMGFLTLNDEDKLIPLDGQHRLKAIQFAIEGKDEKGKEISDMSACPDLKNEDVTIILIHHDTQKSRQIFTRVNSYARPTGKGQNLVTDDEDFIAISAREIANNQEIIGPSLVKYTTNTLGDKEGYFTTLATIAKCNKEIMEEYFGPVDDPLIIDNKNNQKYYMRKINEIWIHLTENIKEFSDMLADKTSNGDEKRKNTREKYLLGKPAPQVCVFKAFIRLIISNQYSPKEASDLLNKINWAKNEKLWDRLLMLGPNIIPAKKNMPARIIYYIAGGSMSKEEEDSLLKDYQNLFPDAEQDTIVLPKKVD